MMKTVKSFDIQKSEPAPTTDMREAKPSSLANFLIYNNTVPIIFGALFLMTGGAFAATNPDVQQAVISESSSVQTIDNTYITSVDLETYPMKFEIKNVQEDEENYYVTYTMHTVDVKDSVWQDIAYENTMKVQKSALNGDLGTYVQEELGELWDHERARLKETQQQQRARGVTQKSVATVYGGLLGKFITPTETTFDEYVPTVASVIPKSPVAESFQTMRTSDTATVPQSNTSSPNSPAPSSQESQQAGPVDTEPPVVTILGDSPISVDVGNPYVDLGVVVLDAVDRNPGLFVEIDGVAMTNVSIDTSIQRTYTIIYKATDRAGNVGVAERIVSVVPASNSSELPVDTEPDTTPKPPQNSEVNPPPPEPEEPQVQEGGI
jgi:hypothetical protein